jgi:hypothetical protein
MSSSQDAKTGDKEKSTRRRSTGSGRRRNNRGPKKAEDATGAAGETTERVKRERPASIPVPPELVGKSAVGYVTDIVRRGRFRFGFINIGAEEKPVGEVPRIYFNFESLAESEPYLRRGYLVEFTVQNDEQGRPFASGVKLTEKGKELAKEREAKIAEQRAERGEAPKRAPRERRPPMEDRNVVLKVTCQGKSEEKSIEFNVAQSVGKLKNVACTAFEAPITYNVFHVTKENPKGEFLTKSVLSKMNDGDAIHLAEPAAEEK